MARNDRNVFRLHDQAILGIVRAVQQGFMTATDVSDHLRMMRFEPMRDEPSVLTLTDEFLENERRNLERLVSQADEMKAQMGISKPTQAEIIDEVEGLVADMPDDVSLFLNGEEVTGKGGKGGLN